VSFQFDEIAPPSEEDDLCYQHVGNNHERMQCSCTAKKQIASPFALAEETEFEKIEKQVLTASDGLEPN